MNYQWCETTYGEPDCHKKDISAGTIQRPITTILAGNTQTLLYTTKRGVA